MAAAILVSACGRETAVGGRASEAAPATRKANAAIAASLDLASPQDFEDAARGFIARPSGRILGADGSVVMDFEALGFVDGDAPPTVNPSLWRHARLNGHIGLFKVTDGIHQLRGFDIANMTLIDGASGWIVVDPLTSREAAAAAIAFAHQQLGERPVSALVFTHSHIDHFGGVLGVISAEEASARKVPIVAPAGFMEEATSENIMVGLAMGRRSAYQFGRTLPRSPTGLVDAGLGRSLAYGTFGLLPPTLLVTEATQKLTLDGVEFVFHNTPGAEAPAELTFEVPARKAYCGAELLSQNMHNLLPVRGAKVRDALLWSRYLDQALQNLGGIEVYFASHNWPVWGHERVVEFVTKQRDLYRYMHDQTVRLLNAGLTADEIAAQIALPKSLAGFFAVRGYYGDLRHNARAIYQHYLGFYDGNPARLDPLPPEDAAQRYVALLGGADAVVAAAQRAFDGGEFRWAAQLLNHVMFQDPGHRAAAELLARTYEQLGYGAESATWRNSYLTAAQELRAGPPREAASRAPMIHVLQHVPVEHFLDALAAALNGPEADGVSLKINLALRDTRQSWTLWIENAVLHHRPGTDAGADATLTLTKAMFVRMMAGTAGAKDLLLSDEVEVTGSRLDLGRFFALLEPAAGNFAIVTK
jgi:alkyl sulfatase BDS1-like metallo-beta-lactamase superfamily hydrolase